jgi:hypothetical protein
MSVPDIEYIKLQGQLGSCQLYSANLFVGKKYKEIWEECTKDDCLRELYNYLFATGVICVHDDVIVRR